MISAFFAGIGGGLYGALLGTVDPKNFLFTLTYNFGNMKGSSKRPDRQEQQNNGDGGMMEEGFQ